MPLLTAAVRGDLRAAMEAEVRDAARAMRRGVARAGREVQAELRAQARAAGFTDRGRAVANAWRLSLYPPPAAAPRTLRPAALVWSNAPKLVEAFDRGIPIVARGAGATWPSRPRTTPPAAAAAPRHMVGCASRPPRCRPRGARPSSFARRPTRRSGSGACACAPPAASRAAAGDCGSSWGRTPRS